MARRKTKSETSYWDKLKDPRWQKKRLEVFQRDEFACTWCGESDKTLHVHHAYYEWGKEPWDYDTATLHTVCEDCHDTANNLRRDMHFEEAKLWLEVQCSLFHFVAAMRDKLTNGDMLVLLGEMTQRCFKDKSNAG